MGMKIAFLGLEKKEEVFFKDVFGGQEVVFFPGKIDTENASLFKDFDILSVFVRSKIDKRIIDLLPNLKFIATRSTGFDHIDCEYAKSRGVAVATVPAYGSNTVAEFAFGLILNLSRKIIVANNHITSTLNFNYNDQMEGFDLHGKTLGVVGTGKIGKNVIRIARGFGMNVVAYDLYKDEAFAKELDFSYLDLDQLMSKADIITLHAPCTKENHHLINMQNIQKVKRGAILINTARGELLESNAVLSALKDGILGGFGADVLEDETVLENSQDLIISGKITPDQSRTFNNNQTLMKMPNVIITPHVAFYTTEAVHEIFKTTIENINAFIKGNPVNLVK